MVNNDTAKRSTLNMIRSTQQCPSETFDEANGTEIIALYHEVVDSPTEENLENVWKGPASSMHGDWQLD